MRKRLLGQLILAGALAALPTFLGCSKKEVAAPPPAAEQTAAPEAPAAPNTPAVQIQTPEQVKANWDTVSQNIANQNYENAVRMWAQLEQAQRQAQLNEAARREYERNFYLAREALRQRAETDARAREAYQALGRAITGR